MVAVGARESGAVGVYVGFRRGRRQGPRAVRGLLPALPLLFVWIYFFWAIVLFGAEVAFAYQNLRLYRREVRATFAGEADVLCLRLNWTKRYITLGPVATLLGLAFQLLDPDGLLGGEERLGITVALIPTDTPGITIGRRHRPMNQAFHNGPTVGENVIIPVDWIIGGRAMAGRGWMMLMESLAAGRAISLPALSAGSAKIVSRATGAYAAVRNQFNTPVGQFEGVYRKPSRASAATPTSWTPRG